MASDRRLLGYAVALSGVALFTPDALMIRLADAEPFTYILIRSLLVAGALTLGIALFARASPWPLFRRMGRPGIWAGLLNGVSSLCFVFAFSHTAAANVLVYIAAQPALVGAIAWLVIREPVGRSTLFAMLGTAVGIGIVVSHSLGTPSLLGDGAALMAALLSASWFVVLRRHAEVDLVPSVALSGLITAGLCLILLVATGTGWSGFAALGWSNIGWTLLNCGLMVPLALGLVAIAPRLLPAAEVSLLMLIEVVVGPLWVWAVLGEVPPTATLIGGTVILLSVGTHAALRLRHRRAPAPA
jgi:drug/metabolite transporter (DMT)-like permease